MVGKRTSGGRSKTADTRQKRQSNPIEKQLQRIWRIGCLKQRAKEDRLTEKNMKEVANLRLRIMKDVKAGKEVVVFLD